MPSSRRLARAVALAGLGAAVSAGAVLPAATRPAQSADPRPNIVLVYLDDVNPKAERLWCGSRTPELQRFCEHGVEFRNAFTATPICGPSRANLLTGQYSHHHGVTDNDPGSYLRFDSSSTLATSLRSVGYHTIFAGKPINGIGLAVDDEGARAFARGWDDFGMIWKRSSRYKSFYDYNWWTRYQVQWKGHQPDDHSTKIIGTRIARQIRNASRDKPVFAMAAVYSGHTPNIAMANHVGARACRDTRPWRAKSYNEANVSDKPAYIRAQPRLRAAGFGLRTRCEEMISVDWVMARIRQALSAEGRLYNTLIIFMADNGVLMGDHRKPAGKRWPHSTPIPLYMLWPRDLGNHRRVVTEPVSDVDLAPTLCRLAGCALDEPDGLSLLPLLRGQADRLDREFLYLEHLHPNAGMPPWYGLVTTRSHAQGPLWQYVEYDSGERELYDLKRDPLRLSNAAGWQSQQGRVAGFHQDLHDGVVGPDGVAFRWQVAGEGIDE